MNTYEKAHPEHVDCADGCGLAVEHDGACRGTAGGAILCTENNHEGYDLLSDDGLDEPSPQAFAEAETIRRGLRRPSHDEADRLLDYALTICTYGERAPGGNENWRDFADMAENYLRRKGCAARGQHTPHEPACPDCRTGEDRS